MLWTYSQFPEIPGNYSGSGRLKTDFMFDIQNLCQTDASVLNNCTNVTELHKLYYQYPKLSNISSTFVMSNRCYLSVFQSSCMEGIFFTTSDMLQSVSNETHTCGPHETHMWPPQGRGAKNSHGQLCKYIINYVNFWPP